MRLADGKYGTIIYGMVMELKHGSGNAAGKLTIVSLAETTYKGTATDKIVKVLCWNSARNEWNNLSDKARKLLPGQIVTFRVKFDIGDPNKATAFEMKKKGIYHIVKESMEEQLVICGKIAKTVSSEAFFGVYVPLNRYTNSGEITDWYLVSFFGEVANKQRTFLGKGDFLFVRGKIKEISLGDKCFKQVLPVFTKSIISA